MYLNLEGLVVQNVDSTYPPDSDFFNSDKSAKNCILLILMYYIKIKSDFNSKMLNCDMGFTNYWTCLES